MMRREEWATRAAIVILVVSSIACSNKKKTETTADAGETAATTTATTAVSAHVADVPPSAGADDAGAEATEEITDGGFDAGRRARRLRRIDAGVEAQASAAPPPVASAAPPAEPNGKRGATPMGNDQPYGASAASGAGILKKAPLPNDDPWKK